MNVVDASVLIEWSLGTALGDEVAKHIITGGELSAPHLVDIEVAQVLRRAVRRGEATAERARAALDAVTALDVVRYDHRPLAPRIWALRDNITAYDAAYVALAEALNAPLLTTDGRLAKAPGHIAQITVIALP